MIDDTCCDACGTKHGGSSLRMDVRQDYLACSSKQSDWCQGMVHWTTKAKYIALGIQGFMVMG